MRTAAALLCLGLAAAACTPSSDAPRDRPSGAPSSALAAVEYSLFAPELDGAEPSETTVYADRVSTIYAGGVPGGFTLSQQPDRGRKLCAALSRQRLAGDTCTVTDGVMVTRMEEFSGIALVREGTVLFASGLVTEVDAELLDRVTEALRTAPEATLADLGDVRQGEEVSEAEVTPLVTPGDFDAARAMGAVRHLAGTIGPREATGAAFQRAAAWVDRRFGRLGYSVQRQVIDVPAGNSWGVPVNAGRSVNVIAWPPGFTGEEPHLVVGAHLDTVPQAPGAEDNASGVGVMLASARAVAPRRTRLPVVFVAFGAEEPRGETDADHHYGSRTYVRRLPPGERGAIRGMVSLDRVGVGDVVPIGSARDGRDRLADQLARAARLADVPMVRETNRSSDHWQFVQAGLPGVRLGSTPYAAYHSSQDVPTVVDPEQLERVGRIVLAWLAGPRSG